MTHITDKDLPLQKIYEHEKTNADRIYLTQPHDNGKVTDYTWGEVVGQARKVAANLQAQGYPKGSCVAIMAKNCAHWLMADYAIWMAGYVSVPLYPTLTTKTVRQILEHSEAKAIFIGKLDNPQEMLAGIPDGLKRITFPFSNLNKAHGEAWDDIVIGTAPIKGTPVAAADDIATIIYTSGTTGTPKGVVHNFATLAWAPKVLAMETQPTIDDRMISYLPLSHVAERSLIETLSIQVGMRIFFSEGLETFIKDIQRARPTVFLSVPRLWVKFQQGVSAKLPEKKLMLLLKIPFVSGMIKRKVLGQLGLDNVRMACSGAAPTPESVLRWYRALGLQLLEGYGMTEVFGLSHLCRPNSMRVGYVGEVMPDVDCKLSELGEVLVKSQGNALGYYKDEEKTAELLTEDGYIRTGDKGVIDEQGRLKITGRVKEIFKTSKGKYVAPAPIENLLTSHRYVEACCVSIGQNEAQPYALVVLSPDAKAKAATPEGKREISEELRNHMAATNSKLDDHEQLAFLSVCADDWTVDNGLVTPTFKVKRNVIEDTYHKLTDAWYENHASKGGSVLFQLPVLGV